MDKNNDYNIEDLIGPRQGEGEQRISPENIQLEDGTPLYFALLEEKNPLTLSTSKTQDLKSELAVLISVDPASVMLCQGKSFEEAKEILGRISNRNIAA